MIGSQVNQFDSILALGDSMTDNGFDNDHGFQRYSNGPVWVEYLAAILNQAELDCRAWGGALSGSGNYHAEAATWSGLLWQIEQLKGPIRTNTLITLEIGINDLHDSNNGISPLTVVSNISIAISRLMELGAKSLLVWNLPAKCMAPGFIDPEYESYNYFNPLLATVVQQFREANQLLQTEITRLQAVNPSCRLILFDFDVALNDISRHFVDTESAWQGSHSYPEPGQWMWWDHWHLMTECHAYIAVYVAKLLVQSDQVLV